MSTEFTRDDFDNGSIHAPGKQGPGIDPVQLKGLLFLRNENPECHEHCDSCMDTICPCSEHNPNHTFGFVACVVDGDHEYDLWLCPDCYEWLSGLGHIHNSPSLVFPPR